MNKFTLNTLDKQITLEHETSHIYAPDYKIKIKKNELHTPSAAKIIVENNGNIYSFLVKQPIIKVDHEGDIHVWTPSKFTDASGETEESTKLIDKKNIKKTLKLLKSKAQLGLTPSEVADFIESESQMNIIKLSEKKIDPMIGGGF